MLGRHSVTSHLRDITVYDYYCVLYVLELVAGARLSSFVVSKRIETFVVLDKSLGLGRLS